MSKPAVVLSSGGLDSTTAMALARRDGFDVFSLSVDYGQRHRHELDAARRVAEALGARRHLVLTLDMRPIGGSALTSDELAVPHGRDDAQIGMGIPATYVPARNTIMLSLALAWAETLGAADIFIGVNALDYSGYPDCRPEYVRAFEVMAGLATRAGVQGAPTRIHAPLIELTKAQIIRLGAELGVDYGLTFSCYDPSSAGVACGACDACHLRLKGFREAGLRDPIPYQTSEARA